MAAAVSPFLRYLLTMFSPLSLAVVGFGTMGRAIVQGLLQAGYAPQDILVLSRSERSRAGAAALGLTLAQSPADVAQAQTLLLCVKPKDFGAALSQLQQAGALAQQPLVLSVAAGVTLAQLEAQLPPQTPVIRAMPNTASAIRQGMTLLVTGTSAGPSHIEVARTLFEAVGAVLPIEERWMDAATSISGSGPAFIYLVLEALADGGVQCGLPRTVALELAAQMTAGAAQMVLQTEQHPAVLKDQVTTPAGSTIAGLAVLEAAGVRSVLANAVERAALRAGELGK